MKMIKSASRIALAVAGIAFANVGLAAISESEKANAFFQKSFEESLANKPIYLTYLGMKKIWSVGGYIRS